MTTIAAVAPPTQKSQHTTTTNNNNKTKTTIHHDNNGNEICNIFLTKGKCRYGSRCHRSHDIPDELAAHFHELRRINAQEQQQKTKRKNNKKEKERGGDYAEKKNQNKKIAMHYIKEHVENYNNVYLTSLLCGELSQCCGSKLLQMCHDSSCKRLLNHNSLKKELTESLAALNIIGKLLGSKNGRSSCHDDKPGANLAEVPKLTQKLKILDVCSGKGIFSLLSPLTISTVSTVHMIDSDTRMNLSHLSTPYLQNKVSFYNFDIYSLSFEVWLKMQYQECVERGEVMVMVGLHLCGTLSTRLTHLFGLLSPPPPPPSTLSTTMPTKEKEVAEDVSVLLILSPCCMPKRDKAAVEYCRLHKDVDPYTYWCQCVYNGLNGETEYKRGMFVDENVLSNKNRFIWTIK